MARAMIPSSNPGHHWAINVGKVANQAGMVYVAAQEGKLGDDGRSFEYTIFESRRVRDVVPCKRLTAAKMDALVDDLIGRMREHGLLAKAGA